MIFRGCSYCLLFESSKTVMSVHWYLSLYSLSHMRWFYSLLQLLYRNNYKLVLPGRCYLPFTRCWFVCYYYSIVILSQFVFTFPLHWSSLSHMSSSCSIGACYNFSHHVERYNQAKLNTNISLGTCTGQLSYHAKRFSTDGVAVRHKLVDNSYLFSLITLCHNHFIIIWRDIILIRNTCHFLT